MVLLRYVLCRYKEHAAHSGFFDRIMATAAAAGGPAAQRLSAVALPISREQVPSSELTTEQAADFVRRHSEGSARSAAAGVVTEEADGQSDFEDMD